MNTGTCLKGYIYKFKPSIRIYVVDEIGKLLLNGTHVAIAIYVMMLTSTGKLSLNLVLHDVYH